MRKMWRSGQKFWQNLAEFSTVQIVGRENASRFLSGAPVKICHILVNFFITIAKIFHDPSKVSYVDLSSMSFSCRFNCLITSLSIAIQIWRSKLNRGLAKFGGTYEKNVAFSTKNMAEYGSV